MKLHNHIDTLKPFLRCPYMYCLKNSNMQIHNNADKGEL